MWGNNDEMTSAKTKGGWLLGRRYLQTGNLMHKGRAGARMCRSMRCRWAGPRGCLELETSEASRRDAIKGVIRVGLYGGNERLRRATSVCLCEPASGVVEVGER